MNFGEAQSIGLKMKIQKFSLFLALPLFALGQSTDDFRNYIRDEEGFRNRVYLDSNLNKTVGIGHKLTSEENWNGVVFSYEVINTIFAKDLKIAIDGTKKLIRNYDKQPANVKVALVSMTFNVGVGGFEKFVKFRRAIELFQYDEAIVQINNSKWAGQVPNRAERVIKILKKN